MKFSSYSLLVSDQMLEYSKRYNFYCLHYMQTTAIKNHVLTGIIFNQILQYDVRQLIMNNIGFQINIDKNSVEN